MTVDSNISWYFVAAEIFVIDYQGETKLLGCLVVVLPELDSELVSKAIHTTQFTSLLTPHPPHDDV